MATSRKPEDKQKTRRPPAATPEARENQLIALAYDEAERVIREGRATSQLLTHFLKQGTERERLERVKIENENALLQAKREQLESAEKIEELYGRALTAMTKYQGQEVLEGDDDPELF